MDIIDFALAEDIGPGDLTTGYFCDPDRTATAIIQAKADGVLAGVSIAEAVFHRVDPDLVCSNAMNDGAFVAPCTQVLRISGRASSLLIAERTALNFLQRLSGIATMTHRTVDAVSGTGCIILDTRKTTPGLRVMEKAAVVAGGGQNHRMGLYDRVMLKDNHLAGGLRADALRAGIDRVKATHPDVLIEIEADTLAQAREFFAVPGVDIVLLDNMPIAALKEAVRLRPPGIRLEASGGITLDTIRNVAETGVDFISIGGLTHSAPALDLSLDFL